MPDPAHPAKCFSTTYVATFSFIWRSAQFDPSPPPSPPVFRTLPQIINFPAKYFPTGSFAGHVFFAVSKQSWWLWGGGVRMFAVLFAILFSKLVVLSKTY
jgi:hypothetical protein